MAKGKGISLESMMAAKRAPREETQAAPAAPETRTPPAPARHNSVAINVYVAAEDRARLRMFALERQTSVQALGIRAWNLLLEAEGLPPLAPSSSYIPKGSKD